MSNHEQAKGNIAALIEKEITDFVMMDPSCRLSFLKDYAMWDKPLVKFADGDDPIFKEYKNIIAETHLTPREALAQGYGKKPGELPESISVISWVLPITEETRKSNRNETKVPSRLWSHTRWYGELSNDVLRKHMVEFLAAKGYMAVAPILQPYFKMFNNEKGAYTNWSERHAAYAAGLGTFSLSDGFITERGIAHRCGNVVTSMVIPASPRTARGPYSNCLFHAGTDCRACINRCPAGAISEKGHDKNRCGQYLRTIGHTPAELKSGYDNDKSVIGCGFCQTKVPCEFKNPVEVK
jgi:epoxyqueuosine reductase